MTEQHTLQHTFPLRVLVVDDDPAIVRTLLLGFKALGCHAIGAASAEAGLDALHSMPADLLLTDVRMQGMSGVELVREAVAFSPDTACVVMTAFASYENAVDAIKAGAFDYLPKPFSADQLEHLVRKVSTLTQLRHENQRLRSGERPDWFDGLTSKASMALHGVVERIAPSDATMLLTGETGSGKTELARAIHRRSSRAGKPFVEVVCTAIAETLFESEVFGHVRGAFTGAVRDHAGKFEMADGGTLFLDEIGELSALAQAKLLRFLEDRIIERVGDNHPLQLDVRILAATNRDLGAMVREKTFREDLYYRLNVFECLVPPLRDRHEDIAPLGMRLLRMAAEKHTSGTVPVVSPAVWHALLDYGWPGNVRELRNVMERIALLAAGREAVLGDLPPFMVSQAYGQARACVQNHAQSQGEGDAHDTSGAQNALNHTGFPLVSGSLQSFGSPDLSERVLTLREVEEQHLRRVLALGVSMDRAAEFLGITTVTLWRKRKELGLS